MTFSQLASPISQQVFVPISIILSSNVSHIHLVKDIHSDCEFLLYYKMFQYIQKQVDMHVYNPLF